MYNNYVFLYTVHIEVSACIIHTCDTRYCISFTSRLRIYIYIYSLFIHIVQSNPFATYITTNNHYYWYNYERPYKHIIYRFA